MDFQNFQFEIEHIPFEESAAGKQFAELQKMRQDFEDYKSKQEAERKSDEKRRNIERKRNLLVSLVAGSISGIVSGLFLYYWPGITAFFSSFLQ